MFYQSKKIRGFYRHAFAAGGFGAVVLISGAGFLIHGVIESGVQLTDFTQCYEKMDKFTLGLGGMLFVIGAAILAVSLLQLITAVKIWSLSGITMQQIDHEAEEAGWFSTTKVLVTEHFAVGFLSDIGYQRFSQNAFRLDEIQRIYGRNIPDKAQIYDNKNGSVQDSPFGLAYGKYRINVVASDGEEYLLSEVVCNPYSRLYVVEELKNICKVCMKKNPAIQYGPEAMKHRSFHYPYAITIAKTGETLRGKEAYEILPVKNRQEMEEAFEKDNPAYYYAEGDAVVGMSMTLLPDGRAQIGVDYFADRQEDIDRNFEPFLQGFLESGWKESSVQEEYVMTFGDFNAE